MQALHAKKLEQALRCHDRFPINLEWMVDVFKYKHISSLTTHLKRHFKMNVHYKRFSQEQNKRVWTYFISVECFIGICEYVRHAARKKIANVWLRKVGIKGAAVRRVARERDEYPEASEEDDDDEEEYDEEEDNEDDQEYEYYAAVEELPAKRRRLDEDEEFRLEEDEEDDEERTYFQEMEEEEAQAEYEDTEDSSAESYDSSSSRPESPSLRNSAQLTINGPARPFRSLVTFSSGNPMYRPALDSSSELSSSPCSSPPSSPTSPRNDRAQMIHSNGAPAPLVLGANTFGGFPANTNTVVNPPKFVAVQPAPEPLPTDYDLKDQVDWSYLHLRPNPHPLAIAETNKFLPAAAPMPPPYYFYTPQIPSCNYVISPSALLSNCHWLHLPHGATFDPSGFGLRTRLDDSLEMPNMEDRPFDTNMFLSIPESSHTQQ